MLKIRRINFFPRSGAVLIFLVAALFSPLTGSAGQNGSQEDLARQVGQMLMIGFRGLEVDEDSPVIRDIKNGRIGGVVLFDYDVARKSPQRNIRSLQQLKDLVCKLQAATDSPLLVAVDQEGGKVARLKEKHGFPPTVSQARLGEKNDLKLTSKQASKTASTLAELGINVNLAPVVDVDINPDNPVIGRLERSFSSDSEKVAAHAREVIKSHRQKNVLTALKHFPGHGSSTTDSHHGFTDVSATWREVELEPYAALFKSPGVDMVMTAHVFNSDLDPVWPATLSQKVLHGLLRQEMGFDGVIISDDMQMGAIRDNYSLQTALKRTVLAGTDIIVFGNNLVYEEDIAARARDTILKLVEKGEIPAQTIHESYARIMELKKGLKKN
ncbi:MAG: glycoside hydrolase family 3 protein [Desulfonatronovibrionaceae bacterium]